MSEIRSFLKNELTIVNDSLKYAENKNAILIAFCGAALFGAI